MKILSVEEIKAIVGERYSYFQFSKEKIESLAAKDIYELVWEDGVIIVQALYPDNLICSGIFDCFLVFECHNGLRKDSPSVVYRDLCDKNLVEKIFTFFEQENIKYHQSWLKLKEN